MCPTFEWLDILNDRGGCLEQCSSNKIVLVRYALRRGIEYHNLGALIPLTNLRVG